MPPAKRPKPSPRPKRTKPTGKLADFAETRKYDHILLGSIKAHVLAKTQLDDDRREDIIHPSEMAKSDWCPRATAYRISGVVPDSGEAFSQRREALFQEGHDIHSKYQTWLGEMGVLYGKWECLACGSWEMGEGITECRVCGLVGTMVYREVPLTAEKSHLIVGHADGAVRDKKVLIEIKSVGLGTVRMEEPELVAKYTVKAEESGRKVVDFDRLWRDIKRPFPSHRRQGQIYLWIARQMGLDVDTMVYIYENKGNQDVREFTVKYSEEYVEGLIDLALDIKWAVEAGRVLPRPPEFQQNRKPCTACPFRKKCYEESTEGPRSRASQQSSEGNAVEPGDIPGTETGRRVPRTARRPHRTGRQRPDEVDDPGNTVGRVPGNTTGNGRGRRTVGRRTTRPAEDA